MSSQPSVLITGASTGIGAVYADRFAKRGHDLVLVARNRARMEALAERLGAETGVAIDILPADLTNPEDLSKIESRLKDDVRIGILVNNAGGTAAGGFLEHGPTRAAGIIDLNVTALTRLAAAVAPRFALQGEGAIINIGSVVGLAPEFGRALYGATKAFVLYLSQALHVELSSKGVYIQAVLPAATRTEIWDHAGVDVNQLSGVMEVDDLVDAALVGFDKRETVTIPPLPDDSQWSAYETARKAMFANFSNARPALRYRTAS